jgi:hypothetical protein
MTALAVNHMDKESLKLSRQFLLSATHVLLGGDASNHERVLACLLNF